MGCAWKELLSVLPMWLRQTVDQCGQDSLRELRLRLGSPPQLIGADVGKRHLRTVSGDDLHFVINAASSYSPWAAATAAQGFVTAAGGHRIGMCGEAVIRDGVMTGIRCVTSLCIRVARDFPGIAEKLRRETGSVLIIGSPGAGKTTLLRDLIRQRSNLGQGSVAVVDERGEIFPPCGCFSVGLAADVLTGCRKETGLELLLRTMGPATIAVDEITSEQDCAALIKAGWCGVKLLATAHAASKEDLLKRPVYKPLTQCGIFDLLVTIRPDQSWYVERMKL